MQHTPKPAPSNQAASRHGVALKPVVGRSFLEFCDSVHASDAERKKLEAHLYMTRLRGRLATRTQA